MSAPVEQTMFFVKPIVLNGNREVQANLEKDIRQNIIEMGFRRRIRENHVLTQDDLRNIYPDLPPEIWQATRRHMLGAEVVLVLLEGDGVIGKLADRVGREVSPRNCPEGTLRRRYGSHTPDELGQTGFVYWHNAIHCPKNAEEAARDVAWFFP